MKLVTGAGGFIGSNLVAALEANGDEIAVCDWLDAEDKMKNLENRRIAERISPNDLLAFMFDSAGEIETVFHMGAISSTTETNIALITEVNVTLPSRFGCGVEIMKLPLYMRRRRRRMAMEPWGLTMMTPSLPCRSSSRSTRMAKAKTSLIFGWQNRWRRVLPTPPQWAGLKFFNVYGPNEYHKGGQMSVVPQVFKQISETGRARLFQSHHPDYEDGGQLRDFVWVGDCVEVMLWLEAQPTVFGVFNCGTGQARSFLDLANAVFQAMGKDVDSSTMLPRLRRSGINISISPKRRWQNSGLPDMTGRLPLSKMVSAVMLPNI